jgi:hypothetical protein
LISEWQHIHLQTDQNQFYELFEHYLILLHSDLFKI